MAFTEFYCQSGGDNLNAGSTTGNAAAQTYAGGTFVRATGVFTVASGDPSADGVAVGDFASIYTTAGATVATFVGRVTARDATTITVSLTAKSGATSTVSETAGAATCKVGGAWKGPNGTTKFPFEFALGTMTNSGGDWPRINFKNDADYVMTGQITHSVAGPCVWQGYTTTVADGGKAVIDFGTYAGGHKFRWQDGHARQLMSDFKIKGTGNQWSMTSQNSEHYNLVLRRVSIDGQSSGGSGYYSESVVIFIECEIYNCASGFYIAAQRNYLYRCIASSNSGIGFNSQVASHLWGCIAAGNGGDGAAFASGQPYVVGCDFYDNTGDGLDLSAITSHVVIENCSFVKNGGYGIRGNAGVLLGVQHNCGFGSGTQANTSGTTTGCGSLYESGTVTYGSNLTPWVDPANGDFRITLAAAKGAGRGSFSQTESGQAGAVGYPDIGAAQHADAGGGGGPGPSTRQVVGAGRRWSL